MLSTGLAPIGVVLIVFIAFTIRTLLLASNRLNISTIRSSLSKGVLHGLPLALIVSFTFVPAVSARIFESWSCEKYSEVDAVAVVSTDAAEDPDGREVYFLRGDLGIVCYESPEHTRVIAVATVLILLWCHQRDPNPAAAARC